MYLHQLWLPDAWHLFALTSASTSGASDCVTATFMMEFRCVSVSCERNLDLFTFMTENACSQTYVVPNMEIILETNAFTVWGSWTPGIDKRR